MTWSHFNPAWDQWLTAAHLSLAFRSTSLLLDIPIPWLAISYSIMIRLAIVCKCQLPFLSTGFYSPVSKESSSYKLLDTVQQDMTTIRGGCESTLYSSVAFPCKPSGFHHPLQTCSRIVACRRFWKTTSFGELQSSASYGYVFLLTIVFRIMVTIVPV